MNFVDFVYSAISFWTSYWKKKLFDILNQDTGF